MFSGTALVYSSERAYGRDFLFSLNDVTERREALNCCSHFETSLGMKVSLGGAKIFTRKVELVFPDYQS